MDGKDREHKHCSKCNTTKAIDRFFRRKDRRDGHHSWCKDCMSTASAAYNATNRSRVNATRKSWQANNPEKYRAELLRGNDQRLTRLYGLTLEDRERLIQEQDGKCACCGTRNLGAKGTFFFDHCHLTGQVRGLICGGCNSAIGYLRDSVENALSVVRYLCRTSSIESFVLTMDQDDVANETRAHAANVLEMGAATA